MKYIIFVLPLLIVFFGGCSVNKHITPADQAAQPVSDPKPAAPAASAESPAPNGSLWKHGQQSLFAANKAGRVGDLLTVLIYEQASAKKEAETTADRSSSASVGIPKFFGIETSLANRNPNLDPSKLISASSETEFEGTGSTSREEKLSATLTTQVVDVLNTGNLRIQGSKTVLVNDENQIIRLSGIVRPIDISMNNTIDSQYILDAEIQYMGKGIITEKQQPGWLVRLIDSVWPF